MDLNSDQFDKVQRVSPQHLREVTKPSDDPTWEDNLRYIEENHFSQFPEHWNAFNADVAKRGVRRPIIVHQGTVTSGHHRLQSALSAGLETVPVIVRKRYLRS